VPGRIQRIALATAALPMLLAVVTAVLLRQDGISRPDPVSDASALLAVACYAVVGGLVASRMPRNPCGWLLLLIGSGLGLTICAEAVFTLALREGRPVIAAWALWVNSWVLVATAWPGILLYLLVFPSGLLPSRRWRPFVIGLSVLSLAGVFVKMVQPWPQERVDNPVAAASVANTLFTAIALGFVAAGVIIVVSVVRRFRRAASADRLQIRWLAVVAVLSAALLVIAIAFGALGLDQIGDPFGVAFLLCLVLGIPASAAVALLKHHLYGIEVVANRSIVYGSMAATISVIYAVIVSGVGAAVGSGDRSNVFAAVGATALAAVVFQPARRRAQRFADRLIYGDRASPYELLSMFTERLDDASLDEVLPRMTTLIAEGTGAVRVGIWLRDGTGLRAVSVWPSDGVLPPPMRLDAGELPALDDPAFAVRHHLDAVQVVLEEGDGRRHGEADDEREQEDDADRVTDPVETERAGRHRDHEQRRGQHGDDREPTELPPFVRGRTPEPPDHRHDTDDHRRGEGNGDRGEEGIRDGRHRRHRDGVGDPLPRPGLHHPHEDARARHGDQTDHERPPPWRRWESRGEHEQVQRDRGPDRGDEDPRVHPERPRRELGATVPEGDREDRFGAHR
jgi:hypothetical protein